MTVLKVIPQTGCEQVETVVCGNSLCPLKIEEICEDKEKTVSALIQGLVLKWTDHFFDVHKELATFNSRISMRQNKVLSD